MCIRDRGGYGNIVCAQPFGCLPNHIVGKGMVNKIRALYPSANITPIDYDPRDLYKRQVLHPRGGQALCACHRLRDRAGR